MDITQILEYTQRKKGVEETFPFNQDTLVLKVGGKMFMLIPLEKHPLNFSVKTKPEWSADLREHHPQITDAYHMNKTHWNSVIVAGLKEDLIKRLIDQSYQLVFDKLPKSVKENI